MTRNSKHKCHQSYHYCLLLLSPSLPLFSLDYLSFLSLLFFIPLFLLSTSIFDLPLFQAVHRMANCCVYVKEIIWKWTSLHLRAFYIPRS